MEITQSKHIRLLRWNHWQNYVPIWCIFFTICCKQNHNASTYTLIHVRNIVYLLLSNNKWTKSDFFLLFSFVQQTGFCLVSPGSRCDYLFYSISIKIYMFYSCFKSKKVQQRHKLFFSRFLIPRDQVLYHWLSEQTTKWMLDVFEKDGVVSTMIWTPNLNHDKYQVLIVLE